MNFRRYLFAVLIAWAGVGLSAGVAAESYSNSPAIRLHWLGIESITTNANAARVMKIWQLPETTALVDQTLDKLSRWPAGGATNPASALLRPLLDDLVSSEFYFELHIATNQQPAAGNRQLLLALRLPAARSDLWQTNLAAAFADLTGRKAKSAKSGWQLEAAHRYGRVELARTNEWTLLAIGPEAARLLPQFAASLSPATSRKSRSMVWLEADIAPAKLAACLNKISLGSGSLSRQMEPTVDQIAGLHFQVSGTNGEVFTRATIALSQPWTEALPPWNIPTNFLDQETVSLTAVRGLSSWLDKLPLWQATGLAPAPDQAYFWSESGIPFQTYGLIPMPQASNQLAQLSTRLIPDGNTWLDDNAEGSFQWQADVPGIKWNDAMMISPWLKADSVNHRDCLLGGLYALQLGDTRPPPPGMLQPLRDTPDLVYYQTEMTGGRIDEYFFITQVLRMAFHRAQLPPKAAGTQWLKQLEPLLNASTTEVCRKDPKTLALTRKSSIGFSALELHLLADWLESPQFPRGLHTLLAPAEQ